MSHYCPLKCFSFLMGQGVNAVDSQWCFLSPDAAFFSAPGEHTERLSPRCTGPTVGRDGEGHGKQDTAAETSVTQGNFLPQCPS